MMPLALMERASSSKASSRNRVRGWNGLGLIKSLSISCGPADIDSRTGTVAVPVEGEPDVGPAAGAGGSGSRMSAPSPRPNAFLGIGDYLLSQLRVALGSFAVYVIRNNGLAEARCLRQANVAGNDALKNLLTEETAQIRGNLAR